MIWAVTPNMPKLFIIHSIEHSYIKAATVIDFLGLLVYDCCIAYALPSSIGIGLFGGLTGFGGYQGYLYG